MERKGEEGLLYLLNKMHADCCPTHIDIDNQCEI